MEAARLKISAGVDRRVLAPQMSLVEQVAPASFAKYEHDCWETSAYRPASETSLHGFGFALDFDSPLTIDFETGTWIKEDMKQHLGPQYQVIWHKTKRGEWHVHSEFDPDGLGIQAFHRRFKEMMWLPA